jgi:toxic protein SymE
MTMKKLRKKKIYKKTRERTYDTIHVPEIRLEGKWLEELGFKEGCDIVIQSRQNKLTIMTLR